VFSPAPPHDQLTYWQKNDCYSNSYSRMRPKNMARPPLRFGVPKSRKSNSWPQTTAQSRPTHPGIPDRGRGSAAKGGGQGQPVGPPRCDHDPRGLPPRSAGCRTRRPALGSGCVQDGYPACPQGQTGYSQHTSHPRGRITSCGDYSVNRCPNHRLCLRPSVARRSARPGSPA
jgi:hypothetical protein